uniref:Uncharacterized protein n=1 Tax=Rhizophora mucronata TaxID=61149 RepID=A0A2P2JW16_RHIMU
MPTAARQMIASSLQISVRHNLCDIVPTSITCKFCCCPEKALTSPTLCRCFDLCRFQLPAAIFTSVFGNLSFSFFEKAERKYKSVARAI